LPLFVLAVWSDRSPTERLVVHPFAAFADEIRYNQLQLSVSKCCPQGFDKLIHQALQQEQALFWAA
jgi:hypothetical protein